MTKRSFSIFNENEENLDPEGYPYTADGLIKKLIDTRNEYRRCIENKDSTTTLRIKTQMNQVESKIEHYMRNLSPAAKQAFEKKLADAQRLINKDKKQVLTLTHRNTAANFNPRAVFSIFAYQVDKKLSLKPSEPKR